MTDMDGMSNVSIVGLTTSAKHRITLKEPIEVNVVQYDDTSRSYVEYDRWEVYGEGANLEEALEDWWDDLAQSFLYLSGLGANRLGRNLNRIRTEMIEEIQQTQM